MAKREGRTILFLGTGNYHRSRFAEILFNSVADKMGLSWRASSRGLAPKVDVGPMAPTALQALKTLGIHATADCTRMPIAATSDDLDKASRIVALNREEHWPFLQDQFLAALEKIEFWYVDDNNHALRLIEREVMDLTARCLVGGSRPDGPLLLEASPPTGPQESKKVSSPKAGTVVRVGRETKGRRGKGVTIVSDVPLDEAGLLDLAAKLKNRCGTGGTVKEGRIEIQGDQRDRLTTELESLGYRVKRVGG